MQLENHKIVLVCENGEKKHEEIFIQLKAFHEDSSKYENYDRLSIGVADNDLARQRNNNSTI